MFERHLRAMNPTVRNISYEISDLYAFIDSFTDISALE